jgi:hypothetical protein
MKNHFDMRQVQVPQGQEQDHGEAEKIDQECPGCIILIGEE